jgi:hypothetical protein
MEEIEGKKELWGNDGIVSDGSLKVSPNTIKDKILRNALRLPMKHWKPSK